MKDRLKKKAEKRKREMVHQLLDLALDINGLEPRKQEITGSLPTAFFNFSGHICMVDIGICADGWYPGADKDKDLWLDAGDQKKLLDGIQELRAIKAETPAAGTAGESR